MKKHLIRFSLIAGVAALLFTAAAFGGRKVECFGNICIADNGGISPSRLPKRGSAPITARLSGEISTRDETHPPALQSIDLDVDKTVGIDAVGLPTCNAEKLQARGTAAAKHACPDAIVGAGKAEVEVAFPEQKPFSSTGPLVLFNGGVHGRTTTVFLHAYVDVPAPTAIVVKATITRIHRGPFGLEIAAKVPKIAGGAGSVTKFELKVGRKFTYKGQKKSFLVASCPTGHWLTKGHVVFNDNLNAGLTHVFPCTPKG